VNTPIKWSGHFWQNGNQYEMFFQSMSLDVDGSISGYGSDAIGEFSLQGTMEDGWLVFKKQYPAHFVNYRGQCTDNSGWFSGNWEIPGDCGGEFKIRCELPRWDGYYIQGGNQNDMSLDMTITQQGVYGQGWDVNGFFVCRGECRADGVVIFRKQYMGKWYVDYYGEYHGNRVTGHWELNGENPEPFELTCTQ